MAAVPVTAVLVSAPVAHYDAASAMARGNDHA
jgi:hypothetical protein